MIELKAIAKSHPKYEDGIRFTMNVNEFLTYYLTLKEARMLLENLTKLVGTVKK